MVYIWQAISVIVPEQFMFPLLAQQEVPTSEVPFTDNMAPSSDTVLKV